MKPLTEYMEEAEDPFANAPRTVGIVPVEKPHNEKPAARVGVDYLRETVDLMETMDWEDAYLWTIPTPMGDSRCESVALTPNMDSKMAILLMGRRYDA